MRTVVIEHKHAEREGAKSEFNSLFSLRSLLRSELRQKIDMIDMNKVFAVRRRIFDHKELPESRLLADALIGGNR